ncbi:hypothetical protein Belba_0518 [Belliella baltica DSM 15883]|uniref:Uncharacterized protein n=1 Tax=Belliella baltica (strain DSM 15883 / CIP 108006 / LMG 21964 / BA134) TaxID=866536 RepID=I3Z1Q8_BELBD|nr:hypothetical protein [Belliella baltica]AFL83176.1 hypothetical protein Belba_0518 [Belliella baltica DSM 15883]
MPNYLKKINNWFQSLFTAKKPVKVENNATPSISISKNPGLKCPECSTRIPISIQTLLTSNGVTCPNCDLELEIDKEKSEGALHALEKLQSGIQKASSIRNQSI